MPACPKAQSSCADVAATKSVVGARRNQSFFRFFFLG